MVSKTLRAARAFLTGNARWLAAGFLLAFGSSFGQTFFIAIFAEPIRTDFSLSYGEWGAIYMVGTLASAALLVWAGPLVDSVSPRWLTLAATLSLAGVCVLTALAWSVWMLPLLVFGLRFFGQGVMSHLSQTLTAKRFAATRGRALATASLGYPAGEALIPLTAVAAIAALGWRPAWLLAAAMLFFAFTPAFWVLLRRERTPPTAMQGASEGVGPTSGGWTRREALRSRAFWVLAPGFVAPSYILTVVFFFPAHIAASKGWPLADWAASYAIYAVVSVLAGLATGWAIDRFSARALVPVYQLPLALGVLTLSTGASAEAMMSAMVLFGISAGATATLHTAIWAELFGNRHLGAIKSVAHAIMVLGSAVGPGVAGALLDLGVPFADQCLAMATYVALVSALWATRRRDLKF